MYVYLIVALIAAALSGLGAWRVQSWRAAAHEKDRIEAAAEKAKFDRRAADTAAESHEKDKVQIRTVTRTVTKEVERIAREEPFYAATAPACLDAAGLQQLEAAIAGRSGPAGEPAPTLPGVKPPHWWQPRRDASVER